MAAANIAEIEQTAQVTSELANDYMIGALGEIAGLQGAAQLQTDVVGLLGDLGVEIAPPAPETGFIAAAGIRLALWKTAKAGASQLAKNPKGWAAALGIASIGVAGAAGTYAWMTEDQTIQLEQIRSSAALQAETIKGMTPEQRAQLAQTLASATFVPPGAALWPWLAVGGALAAWWWFRGRK